MEHVYNNKYQNVIEITSSSNKSIRIWKSLLTGKGIKKHNRAIVSGEKAVLEECKDDLSQGRQNAFWENQKVKAQKAIDLEAELEALDYAD